MKMRALAWLTAGILLAVPAQAERKYILSHQTDFSAGIGNEAGVAGETSSSIAQAAPFFSVSPSIALKSAGRKSVFEISYALLWERFQTEDRLNSASHVAVMSFTGQLSPALRLTLSDTFFTAPDYQGFQVQRGSAYNPEEFRYAYDPLRSSNLVNNARGELGAALTPKSSLVFALGHGFRRYDRELLTERLLSDQVRTEISAGYARKTGEHQGWDVKYSMYTYNFEDFEDSRTHSATFGYDRELSPKTQLTLEAGPSYTMGLDSGRSYPGYVGGVNLARKSGATDRFTLFYRHHSGESSGAGSVSDMDHAGINGSFSIRRRWSADFNTGAFTGRQRLDNPIDTRGFYASAAFACAIHRYWALVFGGSYRINREGMNDLEYYRLYVSFRMRFPEFWRGVL